MSLKEKVFQLIEKESDGHKLWGKVFDTSIMVLIILSIIQIILESFQNINRSYGDFFRYFEIFTVIIFTAEYLLRVWVADLKYPELSKGKARLKFILSPMGMIDLVAILPFYLPFIFKFDLRFIRILRVVRLLRIFKLNRYTRALTLVGSIFYEKRSELGLTILVTFILLLISSTIMYNLENEVQPNKFPDILSTFWWAIATLTTVGYGDVFPVTAMGKIISGVIALLGIGLVALPTGIISAGFIEKMEANKEEDSKASSSYSGVMKYCPHCGKKL